ncbi:HAD family hydrolase [Thermotoga profunda]|uniref:HAD family hydrolase n=1 Tax=Thermotoga profunda TaxID=1508420 RepID=UPI000A439510|nr:HAD family phosphatase [Thermotoga profunda]
MVLKNNERRKTVLKNIVFDLGRVLVSWGPYEFMLKNFPKEVADHLNAEIFEHPDWQEIDRGSISQEEFWERKLQILVEYKQYILSLKKEVPRLLKPIQENVRLLPILKDKGFRLFVLSNFGKDNFEMIYRDFEFFKIFDGIVVSAYVHSIKPEEKIYLELINKYKIVPQQSLFIDDKFENIQIAQNLGFKTLHLPKSDELSEKLFKIINRV